jgi:hypothetical protein
LLHKLSVHDPLLLLLLALHLQGCEIGQQAFCLMSPTQRPYELGEASKAGNLLTMFLTGPLMGFCLAAGNTDPSIQQLVDLQVRRLAGCGALLGAAAAGEAVVRQLGQSGIECMWLMNLLQDCCT